MTNGQLLAHMSTFLLNVLEKAVAKLNHTSRQAWCKFKVFLSLASGAAYRKKFHCEDRYDLLSSKYGDKVAALVFLSVGEFRYNWQRTIDSMSCNWNECQRFGQSLFRCYISGRCNAVSCASVLVILLLCDFLCSPLIIPVLPRDRNLYRNTLRLTFDHRRKLNIVK